MQYSRALLMVVLAVIVIFVIFAGYGQQPASSQSGRRLALECDHAVPPAGMHWVCNDRNNPCNCRLESDHPGGGMLDGEGEQQLAGSISSSRFEQMMSALAAARKEGNPAKAADLFTHGAVYSSLTAGQTYKGQEAIARWFGTKLAAKGKTPKATLTWHHLFFNEADQVGAGEFTQEGNSSYHGVVVLKIENGKISHWREYRLASSLSWERFTADNQF